MGELRLSRRRMLGAGAAGALGVLMAPQAVLAQGEVDHLRWDLVAAGGGAIVPTGTDVAADASTGDKVSLTGSGFARPDEGTANGGGTFVHRHADGSEVAHGVYAVTGFESFQNAGGSLVGTGLTDTIGRLDETTGGILSLGVNLLPEGGSPHAAVLGVHCSLPGSSPVVEGVTLSVPDFGANFVQSSGGTLFHVLED